MPLFIKTRTLLAVLSTAAFVVTSTAAFAQSGGKPAEAPKAAADSAQKDNQKKIDEIAEASRTLTGAAGHPECV